MVASEAAPFAKTGGLADVVGALPRALGRLGHSVDVVMPRYRGLDAGVPVGRVTVPLGGQVADAAIWAVALNAHAAELGHYNGGLLNIRDYFVPAPGLYGGLYNYFYTTDRLNDRHGDEITSVTINPRGGRGSPWAWR